MPDLKEKDAQHFQLENEKLRILVVDDDENIREILNDTLSMAGHHIILSCNGEEALKFFYDQEFDLVITDLGMPGISGWEVNRRIKKTHPEKPVVIISGWGAQLTEEEIKASKVDLVLSKPFNLDQIIEVAKMFGNKARSNRETLRVPI
jgi:DNA-binding NtrC family response regulator